MQLCCGIVRGRRRPVPSRLCSSRLYPYCFILWTIGSLYYKAAIMDSWADECADPLDPYEKHATRSHSKQFNLRLITLHLIRFKSIAVICKLPILFCRRFIARWFGLCLTEFARHCRYSPFIVIMFPNSGIIWISCIT